jgi:hypothetical protein
MERLKRARYLRSMDKIQSFINKCEYSLGKDGRKCLEDCHARQHVSSRCGNTWRAVFPCLGCYHPIYTLASGCLKIIIIPIYESVYHAGKTCQGVRSGVGRRRHTLYSGALWFSAPSPTTETAETGNQNPVVTYILDVPRESESSLSDMRELPSSPRRLQQPVKIAKRHRFAISRHPWNDEGVITAESGL